MRDKTSYKWIVSLRFRIYLWILQFRLWLNDLYIQFYFRYYLRNGYEMEFDPDLIFEQLVRRQ